MNYKEINDDQLIELLSICKLIGNSKFLRTLYAFKKNSNDENLSKIIKYYKVDVLNDYELEKLRYIQIPQFDPKTINKIFFIDNKIMIEEEYNLNKEKGSGRQIIHN